MNTPKLKSELDNRW
ncbi:unnamed protein product, partial [Didymodactylos carnosus]